MIFVRFLDPAMVYGEGFAIQSPMKTQLQVGKDDLEDPEGGCL